VTRMTSAEAALAQPAWRAAVVRPASLKRRVVAADLGVILLAALATPILFAALRRLGFPLGLRIIPTGEDYNWLRFLMMPTAGDRLYAFWIFDWRNPLSPWWYEAARSLYTGPPNGPYLTRLLMGPVLGTASYAMVMAATAGRSRALAVAAGVLSAGWTFNAYVDQIYWNMLGGLSCSMLCIACHAAWLRGGRMVTAWHGVSLLFWFAAFTTYAFQSGAILGLALLSVLHPPDAKVRLLRRFRRAAADMVPYVGLFLLFQLIWITVRHPGIAQMFALSPEGVAGRAVRSLWTGVWPGAYLHYADLASRALGPWLPPIAIGVGVMAGAAIWWRSRNAEPVEFRDGLLVVALALALSAPTVLLEATSAIWTLGTRWRMLDQGIKPLLWLGGGAAVLALLPFRWRRAGLAAVSGGLVAILVTLSLGHNVGQTTMSAQERSLREGVSSVVEGVSGPVTLIVLVEPGVRSGISDVVSAPMQRVWFPGRDVGLRILQPRGLDAYSDQFWYPVRVGDDRVVNARVFGGEAPIGAVRVLRFDGHRVVMPANVGAADVAAYDVVWERDMPLAQP
jgi:hypothetical protein